jgi:AraC-like DNA-binding protein/quercetin dioxygenase-like cupin family protein
MASTIVIDKYWSINAMIKLLDTNVDAVDRLSTSLHLELGQFETPWHDHRQRHQLLYPTGGVLHLLTEQARLLLPAKHGALIPAGILHRLESNSPLMMLRTIYFRTQPDDPIEFGKLQTFPVDKLGQEMIAYTARWKEPDAESELELQMTDTLRLLVRQWCRTKLPLRLPATRHQRLNQVIDYIHADLGQRLPLSELAGRFGFSIRTLIRLFNLELGMTFGQYKKMARMIRATELLSENQLTVTEVMFKVGYESQSSFSRSFKVLLGVTPGEFRKLTS